MPSLFLASFLNVPFTTTKAAHIPFNDPQTMKNVFASSTVVLSIAGVLSTIPSAHAAYNLVQTWQGQSFFNGWEFYGNYDNLTNVSDIAV